MPRVHPIRSGEIVELGQFGSAHVKARRVRVYVPAPSAPGTKRPALVLFDGQNVFGDEGSFAGGWHAHDAVDRLALAPIVVAIDHGNESRVDELSPFAMNEKGGREDAMLDLLVTAILPAVHRLDVQPRDFPCRTLHVARALVWA